MAHVGRRVNFLRFLISSRRTIKSITMGIQSGLPALCLTLAAVALIVLAFATPSIGWLPEVSKTESLLGNLLTAQAAITALTLAVTLFVMQGVSARRDVDDRMYREYVHRSSVRLIFWCSLGCVLVTAAALTIGKVISEARGVADVVPGLPSLILVAATAFIANLALAGLLFERAIRFARPEQWRTLRRNVNERDVREAVQVFLGRSQGAVTALEANDTYLTNMFPDPREGSADEAIKALLNDALRAMAERQQVAFAQSLASIKELVIYAMDEIERGAAQWGPPGSQAYWPPMGELGRNLDSFREEVIRESNRDYVFELLNLDYWLARTGVNRRCGEMFTVGLNGYRRNYQIANRSGAGEFREILRDQFSLVAKGLLHDAPPAEAFPYAREMVRHQERLLSESMQVGRADDFERLQQDFAGALGFIIWDWERGDGTSLGPAGLSGALEQDHRIALMGLAGRAVLLAESGRIANANPYLEVSRAAYTRPETLADDVAQALVSDDYSGLSLWYDWEMEGGDPNQARVVTPERYPLTFFAVRLMELCSSTKPTLNLRGSAKRVFDRFVATSAQLENNVHDDSTASKEQRRESATEALGEAVHRDEIEEDHEIIERELSADRVSVFTSDVYAAAFGVNSVERLFDQARAFVYLPSDAKDGPQPRGFMRPVPKAFLTDSPENARRFYEPLDGSWWGRGLSDDVVRLLCDALDAAPEITGFLDTSTELLQAVDQAVEELDPSAEIIFVGAGDWSSVQVDLNVENPEGYEPAWRLPEADRAGLIGQYRTHPILRGPSCGERRVYVVEPGTWGCFVRAQFDGDQDLSVEIKPISTERARELLEENPRHFAQEPDQESKLRKLRTLVEMDVCARTGFCVIDPCRSRKITGVRETEMQQL